MTDYFTADLHLRHSNIIKHCRRPFVDSQEHDETIIENFNKVITKSDNLYILGDIAFSNAEHLLCRLNGQKHIVLGNHDRPKIIAKYMREANIQQIKDVIWFKRKDIHIWLSHYPHRSWKNRLHGSYHAYGHLHGLMEDHGLSTDVGVDCWNFQPLSLEQFLEHFKNKEVKDE